MAEFAKAIQEDIPELQQLYDQAVLYAGEVGKIDWDYPFPTDKLKTLISDDELYCARNPDLIAAVRLSNRGHEDVWPDNFAKALYVGKLAVDPSIRQNGLALMAPLITDEGVSRGATEGRFDCLSDNLRLKTFYAKHFEQLDDVTFISGRGMPITVSKFRQLA